MVRGFIFLVCIAFFLGCAPKNFNEDSIALNYPPQDLHAFTLDSNVLDKDTILSSFECKLFAEYDGEWLDFIVESRLGNKPWQKYDYIEGGVANDRVIDTINLYMSELMSREDALGRLAEHRPNNQMCILNQTIIDKFLIYNGTV